MFFSVITPTYKRPDKLKRAIDSLLSQEHRKWEMIIINDNPADGTLELIQAYNDSRIVFLENQSNAGVNYSRNQGLNLAKGDYVIFLDDDDYLAPSALSNIATALQEVPHSWFITSRGTDTSSATTHSPRNGVFSYAWDYLITKKIKGDATHAIAARYINNQVAKVRFPTIIKQAEEWLFYYELSMYTNPYFQSLVTTLTDGYSSIGLNNRTRTTKEQLRTVVQLFKEGLSRGLFKSPLFYLYMMMRVVRSFIKRK
jgi:glycosyltransferase involved in cell wall biosynthesis